VDGRQESRDERLRLSRGGSGGGGGPVLLVVSVTCFLPFRGMSGGCLCWRYQEKLMKLRFMDESG